MDVKKIINKKGKVSKAEIAFLLSEGERWGVEPPRNEGCPDCWRDMAVAIMAAMRKGATGRTFGTPGGGVIFKGRVIMDADLEDPATLEWMEANGFPMWTVKGGKA